MAQKDEKYIPKIARDIPLEEQNLREETISILAYLKLNCFCDNEEKKQFVKMLNENERKYQEELKEKYNPDTLFVNKVSKVETIEKSVAMVEYKELFFIKIKNWFKRTI